MELSHLIAASEALADSLVVVVASGSNWVPGAPSLFIAAATDRFPFERLFEMPTFIFIFAFAIVAVTATIKTVKSVIETREREQTRREIAAYLSQGMLTDEQAALLLSKGKRMNRPPKSSSGGGFC
jgi:hypothetical protein